MTGRQINTELSVERAIALLANKPGIPQDLKDRAIAAINHGFKASKRG